MTRYEGKKRQDEFGLRRKRLTAAQIKPTTTDDEIVVRKARFAVAEECEQRLALSGVLLDHAHRQTIDDTYIAEIISHPLRGALGRRKRPARALVGDLILAFEVQLVVVAALEVMQIASDREKKVFGLGEGLGRFRRQKLLAFGQTYRRHFGELRNPTCELKVAQPTRVLFYVRFQMIDGLPGEHVALVSELDQVLEQGALFPQVKSAGVGDNENLRRGSGRPPRNAYREG